MGRGTKEVEKHCFRLNHVGGCVSEPTVDILVATRFLFSLCAASSADSINLEIPKTQRYMPTRKGSTLNTLLFLTNHKILATSNDSHDLKYVESTVVQDNRLLQTS